MEPRPLRIAYAIEFLLALIACFECWSQIGGQAPLDLMPWWVKLLLSVGFAAVFVRLTAAAVQNHPFPHVPVIRWGVAFVLVLTVIALTTYYFFLRVPPEEDNSDEPIPTSYILR